MTDAL
jgi:hypothetical protein